MADILIVDDDPVVQRVVRLALEREGHSVTVRSNGALAFEYLQSETPDAMITDIEMPHMTGEELCKAVHETMPNRSFPIFVVTSLTALEHRCWSSAIPDLHFLEKPVSARKLLAELTARLQSTRADVEPSHG